MTYALENPREYYGRTMARAPDAVRTFYTALTGQDRELLLSALTDDFTFKSPLSHFDSPEGFADMVGLFAGWVETKNFVIEGDNVVHTFTYHMTQPGKTDIPVCEVFALRNGKIVSSRAYNDSADFPQPEPS